MEPRDGTKFKLDPGLLGQILKSTDDRSGGLGLVSLVPWTGTGATGSGDDVQLTDEGVLHFGEEEYEMCDPMPMVVEINAVSETVFQTDPDDIRLEARLNQTQNGQSKTITCDVFSNCHVHRTAPPVGAYVEPADTAMLDGVDELASSDCLLNTSRGPSILQLHVAIDCKVLPSGPADDVTETSPAGEPDPADVSDVESSPDQGMFDTERVDTDDPPSEESQASTVARETEEPVEKEAGVEEGGGMKEIHVAVELEPSERDAIEALVSDPPEKTTAGVLHGCSKCEFRSHKHVLVRRHIHKAAGHKGASIKYYCEVCGKDYSSPGNVARHRMSHLDDKPYACPHCYRAFGQKVHVQRHMAQQKAGSVQCRHCEFSAAFRCAMAKHTAETHPDKPTVKDSIGPYQGSIVWQCGVCDFECTSKRDLAQHMKYHTSRTPLNYKCELCSFVTDYSCRLKRHALSHTQERPFRCGLCDYRGSQVEHVMRHMRTIHQTEPKHSLDSQDEPKTTTVLPSRPDAEDLRQTGLLFDIPSPDRVGKDLRAAVETRKLFSCTLCDVGFQRARNLLKHLEDVHRDDENRYVCSICRTQTSTSSPFLKHLASHKPPSTPVEYTCSYCEFTTEKRRNFIYHMQAKHYKIVHFGNRNSSYGISDMYPDLMMGNDQSGVTTLFEPHQNKLQGATCEEVPELASAQPMDMKTESPPSVDPTDEVLQVTEGDLIQINGVVYRIQSSE